MDLQEAFDAGFEAVKTYVERSFDAFESRLIEIERRAGIAGPNGRDGKDGIDGANGAAGKDGVDGKDGRDGIDGKDGVDGKDGADGAPGLDGVDGKDGSPGKDGIDGKDGKDADPVTHEQIMAAVIEYMSLNPPSAGADGKDGADGRDGTAGIDGRDGADGQPGADGKDGTSVSLEDCIPMIEDAVNRAVSAIQLPQGEKGEPGRDGKDGARGERGEKGDPGKDGADVTDAIIDRSGNLLVMLSNGLTKNVGPVIGRDGRDGSDGQSGPAGTPGRDGAVIDDFDLVEDDDGIALRLVHGETVKDVYLPIPLDRGVWKEGQPYRKGAGVTWAGSFWLAQEDTNDKPGTNKSWRLVVKKGRDGREVVAVTPPSEKTVKLQ